MEEENDLYYKKFPTKRRYFSLWQSKQLKHSYRQCKRDGSNRTIPFGLSGAQLSLTLFDGPGLYIDVISLCLFMNRPIDGII